MAGSNNTVYGRIPMYFGTATAIVALLKIGPVIIPPQDIKNMYPKPWFDGGRGEA